MVFSFQLAAHFAKFHVAVSQISCVSSMLRLFLSMLLLCSIIFRFCGLFLSIGYNMLFSFRYISFRFSADLMFLFDFTVFWFHFASMLLGSGWQTIRKT